MFSSDEEKEVFDCTTRWGPCFSASKQTYARTDAVRAHGKTRRSMVQASVQQGMCRESGQGLCGMDTRKGYDITTPNPGLRAPPAVAVASKSRSSSFSFCVLSFPPSSATCHGVQPLRLAVAATSSWGFHQWLLPGQQVLPKYIHPANLNLPCGRTNRMHTFL